MDANDGFKRNGGHVRLSTQERRVRVETAVDGTAAWIVAAACCWIYIVTYGFFRSGGVFLVSIVGEMHATREAASWPFTLAYAFHFLTGPVVALLNDRFRNARVLACIGSVLACTGVFTCYFAKNVTALTFLLGGLYGGGSGLAAITSVIVINKHFLRHRAKANGIQAAGSSLGALVTPLAAELTLKDFGLKRTFVIFSIGVFTSVIGSLLLRSPKRIISRRKSSFMVRSCVDGQLPPAITEDVNVNSGAIRTLTSSECEKSMDFKSNRNHSKSVSSSPASSNEISKSEDNFHVKTIPLTVPPACSQHDIIQNEDAPLLPEKSVRSSGVNGLLSSLSNQSKKAENSMIRSRQGSKILIPHHSKTGNRLFRAVRQPIFYVICANEILYSWVKEMYYMTIVDYAIGLGVKETTAALILSISSIGDLVGRLGQGFFIDTKLGRPSTVIFFALLVCGTLFFILSLATDISLLLFIAVGIGLCMGSLVGTRFLVVLEHMEEDLLGTVVGIVLFVAGIFQLTRPFVLGWFRDVTGSYTQLLYLQGILCFVASCMWLFKLIYQYKKSRSNNLTRRESSKYGAVEPTS